jgi:hypothetical protein
MFDDLYLLDNGECMYRGPILYFGGSLAALGPEYATPSEFSVIDFAMDLLPKLPEDIRKKWIGFQKPCPSLGTDSRRRPSWMPSELSRSGLTWKAQLRVLIARDWAMERNTLLDPQKAVLLIVSAIVTAIVWWDVGFNESDIDHIVSLIFVLVSVWSFFPLIEALEVLHTYNEQLRHELQVGANSLSAWFISRTTVVMVKQLLYPLPHVTVVFRCSCLSNDMGSTLLPTLLAVCAAVVFNHSVGLAISAVLPPHWMRTGAMVYASFCVQVMLVKSEIFFE